MIGNSNYRAISLAEDFINNPLKKALWIHGKNGYGKTELANYLIQRFKNNNRKTYSITAEKLIGSMIRIIRGYGSITAIVSLTSSFQDYDLLVIDNVDLTLKEKPHTQKELKELILEITKNGRTKVVLITNRNPEKLKNLMFDSQYCCYTSLKTPTMGFKTGLLNNMASQDRISIPKDVIADTAKNSKNLFQLKGLFNKIHFKCKQYG